MSLVMAVPTQLGSDGTTTKVRLLPTLGPEPQPIIHRRPRFDLLGTPLVSYSSRASRIVPRQPIDNVFLALQEVIFRTDPKSATPITHIIRAKQLKDGVSDQEVLSWIDGLCSRTSASSSGVVALSNLKAQAQQANTDKAVELLRQKIADARCEHAKNLRDYGLVDVDVVYGCSRDRLEHFIRDKEEILAAGAKAYHLRPCRADGDEMRLGVIVEPGILARFYPPERCQELYITIESNTVPLASEETLKARTVMQPRLSGAGTMFPDWHFETPRGDLEEPVDCVCQTTALNVQCRRSSYDLEPLQKMLGSSKRPQLYGWRAWSSAVDWEDDLSEQTWADAQGPFSSDPSCKHDWVERDRRENAWHLLCWKQKFGEAMEKGVNAAEAVPGVDFPVKTPLVPVYVTDRNYQWHKEHIELPQQLDEVTQKYKALLVNVRQVYGDYAKLHGAATRLAHIPDVRRRLAEYEKTRPHFQEQLREAELDVRAAAAKCNLQPDPHDFHAAQEMEIMLDRALAVPTMSGVHHLALRATKRHSQHQDIQDAPATEQPDQHPDQQPVGDITSKPQDIRKPPRMLPTAGVGTCTSAAASLQKILEKTSVKTPGPRDTTRKKSWFFW